MEFLVLAALLGLIPAYIARSKGKDFVPWWIYGTLILIVALPHAILLKEDSAAIEQQRIADGGLKKCPYCAELIKQEAKICRFCGRDVPESSATEVSSVPPIVTTDGSSGEAEAKNIPRIAILLFMIAAALIVGFVHFWPNHGGQKPIASKGTPQTSTVNEGPHPATVGEGWLVSESVNKMDNTPEVILSKDGSGGTMLLIRCAERKTDVYVDTKTVVDNGAVRVKIDDSASANQKWHESTDHQALFAPDAIGFARNLAKARTLLLEFTPYQEGPRTISFDVSGLERRLAKIAQECDWNAVDRTRAQEKAAEDVLRKRLPQYVHPCDAAYYAGKWCWTDPNDIVYREDRTGFETKEQALDDAVEMTKMGLVFQGGKSIFPPSPEEPVHGTQSQQRIGEASLGEQQSPHIDPGFDPTDIPVRSEPDAAIVVQFDVVGDHENLRIWSDEKEVFDGTMTKGETRTVRGKSLVAAVLYNSASIRLTVNDKVQPPGPEGWKETITFKVPEAAEAKALLEQREQLVRF